MEELGRSLSFDVETRGAAAVYVASSAGGLTSSAHRTVMLCEGVERVLTVGDG